MKKDAKKRWEKPRVEEIKIKEQVRLWCAKQVRHVAACAEGGTLT